MNFAEALEELFSRRDITNDDWNGMNMYLTIKEPYCDPYESTDMSEEYIYIFDADGKTWPWTPSQRDIFSVSWRQC